MVKWIEAWVDGWMYKTIGWADERWYNVTMMVIEVI